MNTSKIQTISFILKGFSDMGASRKDLLVEFIYMMFSNDRIAHNMAYFYNPEDLDAAS